MEPLSVRPGKAAELLGLSRNRVYELIAAGEIGSIKDGSARLIPYDNLRAWVDRRRAITASEVVHAVAS